MPAEQAVVSRDLGEYERDRRKLLSELRGRVLELGAGRGTNLALLPAGSEWIGLEPSPGRHRRLTTMRPGTTVLRAHAEEIPLADSSVDAVFGTKVLCSVADQPEALREVTRVLRPGGRFVFFEHVVAPSGSWRRQLQRAVAPITRRVDHGCDPARETWRALERAPFKLLRLDWYAAGSRRFVGGYGVA